MSLNCLSAVAKDISVKINWVYGFRCHDVRRSIEYIPPYVFYLPPT